jgi:hypothetical protein
VVSKIRNVTRGKKSMTSSKKILPNRQSIVLLFLVERVLPEPPYFLFIIGIFGIILYKYFLSVPGPDYLERYPKDGNRQDQRRLEKILA